MKNRTENLELQGYKKIRFRISKTHHLLVKGSINGVKGQFILDTGASNSCVDFTSIDYFKLTAADSKTRAAGAGAIGMLTQIATDNKLTLGKWKFSEFHLVIFDLSHVNTALVQHKAKPVQGIIGADVLIHGAAIIDYSNKFLYLK